MVHYDNGDNMNKKDLWLLFTKTGKIEYYLKYKNFKNEEEEIVINDKENRRYNN